MKRYFNLMLTGLVLALGVLFLTALLSTPSSGTTIIVDDDGGEDYETIQEAVDNAVAGDEIRVYEGIYLERVTVEKTLSLMGNGSDVTVVDGENKVDVITINANWVNLSGFKVLGQGVSTSSAGIKVTGNFCRIFRNSCTKNGNGIVVGSGFSKPMNSRSFVENNTCYLNEMNGILLNYAHNNTIVNNTCLENKGAGISIEKGDRNTLKDNICAKNSEGGLKIRGSHNLVDNNSCLENSYYGVYLGNSHANTLTNNILGTNEIGILVVGESRDDQVHQNTFQENEEAMNASEAEGNYINATNNWWGNDSGPFNPRSNPWGTGEKVSDHVIIDPWIGYRTTPVRNSITDKEYITIQMAIDDASPKDIIVVTEGTYREHLVIDKELNLLGNAAWKTIITGDYEGDVITITADGVLIADLTIKGSGREKGQTGPTPAGIRVLGNNCEIHDNNLTENRVGIYLSHANETTISENEFSSYPELNEAPRYNYSEAGIYLDNSDSNIISLNKCWMGTEIYLTKSSFNEINSNKCTGGYDGGISLQHFSRNNTVYNNKCAGVSGIRVDNSESNRILDNICMFCPMGIHITISDFTVVEENQCSDGLIGIKAGGKHLVMRNNTCDSNEEQGILFGGSHVLLENNSCFWNGEAGIKGEHSPEAIFRDNVLRAQPYGLSIFGGDENVIDGNEFDGSDYGIYLQSSDENVISNNSFERAERCLWLETSGENLIRDNEFVNSGVGIYIEKDSKENIITFNDFKKNGEGIDARENGDFEVDARENWWWSSKGPGGLGKGDGNSVHGKVLYSPWLTETIAEGGGELQEEKKDDDSPGFGMVGLILAVSLLLAGAELKRQR